MMKPILFESCSALIALVLVVADCRHIAAAAPEEALSVSSQATSDSRQIIQIDLQSRNAEPGTARAVGTDVVRQLSGLSALLSTAVGRGSHAGIGST